MLAYLPLFCEAQLPLNQQQYVDSLNGVLQHADSDSIRARANFFLLYFWVPRDSLKARQYLEEGRRLSKKYPYLYALSYAHEGYLYYVTDFSKSEAAYKIADSLLSKYNTKETYIARSNIWSNCAVIQQRNDNDRGYIDIVVNKAIPLALKANDTALVASQYVGIGVAFLNMKQYEKAEIYLDDALRILKASNTQTSRIISAYNRAAENYIYLEKFTEARAALDTIKQLLAPYPSSELYAGYYLAEGMYLHHFKKYAEAVSCFDKGIALANGPNKTFIIQELNFLKIKSLLAEHKYVQARAILQTLAADEDVMGIENSKLEVYDGLAESYAGLGDYNQAYEYQKKYSALSDSLHESSLLKDVNAMELKYQRAEKEREILALQAKNEQAEYAAKNSRLIILLFALVSISLLIILIFIFLYYKSNKRLLKQKEQNHQQELKELEQQQQLKFGQAVLMGEEQERRRLARDLHDGLGGMLAGIKINLSSQNSCTLSQAQGNDMEKIIGQLDNSVTELRRIAHNMMPINLIRFGLQTALKDLCESLTTQKAPIEFQAYNIEEHVIPEQTQINIYRIVQELLSNAIRHANATNIILQCSQNENIFYITLEDNGRGFDTFKQDGMNGIGLSNIKNRVGFLKGKMEIESIVNEGTTINIELHVGA